MQKIRKFNRNVYEIGVRVKLRYIYGTNTRNRAGPLPRPHGLNMHIQRPPRIISGPPEGHVFLVFSSQHQSATHLVRLRAHSYQSILAVPFGHCQYNAPLSRIKHNFFHKMEDFNTLSRRHDCRVHFGFSVRAFCGVKPHKKCPQFFLKFWKKSYV